LIIDTNSTPKKLIENNKNHMSHLENTQRKKREYSPPLLFRQQANGEQLTFVEASLV